MADYRDLARRLETALQLQTAPVAVSFSATLPKDVPSPDAPVAAGCEFWQIGTERAVATTASDHQFCSIGIHTHALADAPPNQKHELETTLAAMQGLDYV